MYELMSKFDVDSEVFELTIALVKEDNEVKYQVLIPASKLSPAADKFLAHCNNFIHRNLFFVNIKAG